MSYIGDGDTAWNPTGVQMIGQHSGIVQFGNPDAMVVTFYKRSVLNAVKTQAAGMRVHEDQDWVRVQQPGEKEQVVDRPVQQSDTRRWPNQWQDYVQNRKQTPVGIPIDLLFPNHPSIADNLKAQNVHTVEQLANLSATGMANIGMGAQDYINHAKQYLDVAHRGVGFHQMQSELKKRDDQIRTLEKIVETLKGQLDQAMLAMMQRGPGAQQGQAPQYAPQAEVAQPTSLLPPLPTSFGTTFDAQTAQINATHESVELTPKQPVPKSKRPRAKLAG